MKSENRVPSIQDSALRTPHSAFRWGVAMKQTFSILLIVAMVVVAAMAQAQQPKIPRIGYLTAAGSAPSPALLQGLRDLGYVEGQNIAIEYRSADGKRDRVPDLAAELVRLKVNIIVADGS